MSFLSKIDLFKSQVLFYYQGTSRQSSLTGVILSIMIFVFLTYQFANSEFFAKQSPLVLTQALSSTHASRINFNQRSPFMVAIADLYNGERFMDPSVFQIYAFFNINGSNQPIPSHPCTYEDVREAMNYSYFTTLQIYKVYCLQQKNFFLEGFIDEYSWKTIQVSLYPCSNQTSNKTCKTPEEIKQISKTKLLSVVYESAQIDANDYENPLKKKIIPPVVTINPSLKKSKIIYLQNVEVKTDNGWLFAGTNFEIKTGIALDTYADEIDLRLDNSDLFAYISVAASKRSVLCQRVYQKLPEALASVAGMANLFIILGMQLCNLISYLASMRYILNKLYYFEKICKKHEDNKKEDKNKKSLENLQSNSSLNQNPHENKMNKSKFYSMIQQQETLRKTESDIELRPKIELPNFNYSLIEIKENKNDKTPSYRLNQIEIKEDSFILEKYSQELELPKAQINDKKTIEKKRSESEKKLTGTNLENKFENLISMKTFHEKNDRNAPLNLSICEYIKYSIKKQLCCKKTEKEQIIEKAEKIYKNELDISNILTKVHEIENLKLLLLDSDQIVLFNYLTKPIISLKKNEKEAILRKLTTELINKKQFIESYLKCNLQTNENEISKKLVNFCDLKELHSIKKLK